MHFSIIMIEKCVKDVSLLPKEWKWEFMRLMSSLAIKDWVTDLESSEGTQVCSIFHLNASVDSSWWSIDILCRPWMNVGAHGACCCGDSSLWSLDFGSDVAWSVSLNTRKLKKIDRKSQLRKDDGKLQRKRGRDTKRRNERDWRKRKGINHGLL